jgi:hypothetical protein
MSEVHYFPRYSQPENFVTNNTLLLLLRLHEYNHFKFEKFMGALCGEQEVQLAGSLGLQFQQQKGTGKSVVDGFIAQDSIKIAVETKLSEAFEAAQLENHLALFGTEQNKLLILLSPALGETSTLEIVAFVRANALPRNIQVIHTSFEEIVNKCRGCLSEHDEEMLALVDDYESFCSGMDLLPRDRYTIFVPPARLSLPANLQFRLYYCPVERSIRKARYLGVYANKSVQAIGQIAKIVACNVNLSDGRVTVAAEATSVTQEEERRIVEACREALTRDWDLSTGYKFYLCDVMEETDFRKTTAGGIMGQRYIDLGEDAFPIGSGPSGPRGIANIPTDVRELAQLLRQYGWE